MKMKKIIGVTLAAVMGLSCLAACGGGQEADYPEDFQAFLDSLDTEFSYEDYI